MTKIQIDNPNYENEIVDLDEQQSSNISGGRDEWHVFYSVDGTIIGTRFVLKPGADVIIDHHPW
jgi:hypothetical protein